MIECDCSVEHDCEASFSRSHIRTARKTHTCCECGEEIMPGEAYEYATGVFDGSWQDNKTCAICVKIRERYCPRGWIYGELAETIEPCIGFDYRELPED